MFAARSTAFALLCAALAAVEIASGQVSPCPSVDAYHIESAANPHPMTAARASELSTALLADLAAAPSSECAPLIR